MSQLWWSLILAGVLAGGIGLAWTAANPQHTPQAPGGGLPQPSPGRAGVEHRPPPEVPPAHPLECSAATHLTRPAAEPVGIEVAGATAALPAASVDASPGSGRVHRGPNFRRVTVHG